MHIIFLICFLIMADTVKAAEIQGTVVRQVDSQPLENFKVIAASENNETFSTLTVSDGTYVVYDLPEGKYTVMVEPEDDTDYLPLYYDNIFVPEDAVLVDVTEDQPVQGIDFAIAKAGQISGELIRASNGQAVEDLQVSASRKNGEVYSVKSTEDGTYIIKGLIPGEYQVEINPDEDLKMYYNNVFQSDQLTYVNVGLGEKVYGISFQVVTGGKITGTVFEGHTGLPLNNMEVLAVQGGLSSGTAIIDTNGFYTIQGLLSGDYIVKINPGKNSSYIEEYWQDVFDINLASPVTVSVNQTTPEIDFDVVTGGQITGRVVRDTDGSPINSATIEALSKTGFQSIVETDTDGFYIFRGLPSGIYRIKAVAEAEFLEMYFENTFVKDSVTWFPVAVTQKIENINFAVIKGGTITGNVKRALYGQPLGNMTVNVISASKFSAGTETNTTGDYTIDHLPPGIYKVWIDRQEGYLKNYYQDAVDADTATTVIVATEQTTPKINFDLVQGGRISGLVARNSDGKTLSGINIHAESENGQLYSTSSAEDGSYEIIGMPSGIYKIRFEPQSNNNGYLPKYYGDDQYQGNPTPVSVIVEHTTTDIDFVNIDRSGIDIGATIHGFVKRHFDGILVEDMRVAIESVDAQFSAETNTGPDGYYSFTGLPPGTYSVSTQPDDRIYKNSIYLKHYYNNTMYASNAGSLTVTFEQIYRADFDIRIGGKIQGRIISAANNQPIGGIGVTATDENGENRSAQSGADGFYTIQGLPPGIYTVRTSFSERSGYVNTYYHTKIPEPPTPIQVKINETITDIDMELVRGGRISGYIRQKSDLQPIEGIEVNAVPQGGLATTDGNGYYIIDGLPAGIYTVNSGGADGSPYLQASWIDPPQNKEQPAPIVVITDQTNEGINIDLITGGKIKGYCTRKIDSLPMPGVKVIAKSTNQGVTRVAYSQADGTYTIVGLPEDLYVVEIQNPESSYCLDEFYPNTTNPENVSKIFVTVEQSIGGINFGIAADSTFDQDQDGTPDCNDDCPLDPKKTRKGSCGCQVPDTDTDNDQIPDCNDAFPSDPTETIDTDQDGIGDNIDTDLDNDGMKDEWETRHGLNPKVNDALLDFDFDGIKNINDGFPIDPNEWLDTDKDGILNNRDDDDDGDSIPDEWEMQNNLQALNPDDANEDPDRDGLTNLQEYNNQTDPNKGLVQIPNQPELKWPGNHLTGVKLTPTLLTQVFSDPDEDSKHHATHWQIGLNSDLSKGNLILGTDSNNYLTALYVPDLILSPDTNYYWRARFQDDTQLNSEWSEVWRFTTQSDFLEDQNSNGIYDTQEIGLDNQNGIKCVNTALGDMQLCIKNLNGVIEKISAIDNHIIPDTLNHPDQVRFGMVITRLKVDYPGANGKLEINLSNALQSEEKWFQYDLASGWINYSNYAVYSTDRKIITLDLRDGSYGDADGAVNAVIIHIAGAGVQADPAVPTQEDKSKSSPSAGCFIKTVLNKGF